MRKILFLNFLILLMVFGGLSAFSADFHVYTNDKGLYGLKNAEEKIVVEAKYKKIIHLGEKNWIIQNKKRKYGLMKSDGSFIIQPKYSHAERLFDKWLKLGNKHDYGLYDTDGNVIIPSEFSLIEPLFGQRFLTCKKYKYGIYSADGIQLLQNRYDNIYMPSPRELRVQYKNVWYSLKRPDKSKKIELSDNLFEKDTADSGITAQTILVNTGVGTGYGLVTATDYTLKVISSMSRAYEATIDELTFSNGLDAVPVLMNFSWLPKFPFTYAKNYYSNIVTPDNSPLSGVRSNLKEQIK